MENISKENLNTFVLAYAEELYDQIRLSVIENIKNQFNNNDYEEMMQSIMNFGEANPDSQIINLSKSELEKCLNVIKNITIAAFRTGLESLQNGSLVENKVSGSLEKLYNEINSDN